MNKYILSIDAGTSSSRAVVIDKNGQVMGVSQYEFTQYFPNDGWVEHDPLEIWNSQLKSIKDVLKKTNSVIALGGGAFLNNAIRKVAKKLTVSFWLDVRIDELVKRLSKSRQRPLLFGKNLSQTVKKIYFERKKIYNEADYRIKCNSMKSNEIVKKIINLYEKSGNKI